MGFSAPKAPDPVETANAQASLNRDTAITQHNLNTMDQYNPWGSTTYSQNGVKTYVNEKGETIETPNYVQTTTLSPEQQGLYDKGVAAQQNLASLATTLSGNLGKAIGSIYDGWGIGNIVTNLGQNPNIGGGYNTQFSGDLGPNFTGSVDLATSYAGADDFSADRDAYTNAILARNAGNRAATEANTRAALANKGIREGSAAWNQEMERIARQNTDEQYAAIIAGGQEQARMVELARQAAQFGNDALLAKAGFGNNAALAELAARNDAQGLTNNAALTAAGFANQANAANANFNNAAVNQKLATDLAIRNQPVNEISALLSGAQVQNPAAMNTATPQTALGTVDYSGLVQNAYDSQLKAYQSGVGALGGLFGSIAGAAGQAGSIGALFSDRRLKTDIKRVGTTDGGVPIYTYRYVWGGPVQMGVMAQDVPHAAEKHESGYLMVDYSEVK